jgi:hypothetical protein
MSPVELAGQGLAMSSWIEQRDARVYRKKENA